jgi:hypothetical protein
VKKQLLWATVAVASLFGSNVFAQDETPLLDNLIEACSGDIENYCSQVTPGEGRMLYCMAAHEDKISGQCQYAFYETASILEQMSVALNYLAQECAEDIVKLCADVELGEGRVLACLDENEKEVGASCKTAIADTIAD